MLNKEDLRQIGEVMDERLVSFGKVLKKEIVEEIITGVGDMIEENILPQFNRIDERMNNFERRLDRTDGKVNALVTVLQEKRVITEDERSRVLS